MHQHDHKWYDPLHIIMWLYWFIDLDFTCFSPLLRSISAKSSLNLPFTLATGPSSQVLSWSSPPWSHDTMSCLIGNELLHHMCELCNISEPFSPPWHMLFTHMYLWTNHLCISHLNTLAHLGYHLITKTKLGTLQSPSFLVIDDNSTKIWKLSSFGFMLFAQAILPCVNDFGQVPQTQIGSISSPLHMC